MRGDLISVIEASYRVEEGISVTPAQEVVWLHGVREALGPLLRHGMGAVGATYDSRDGPLVVRCLDVAGQRGGTSIVELIGSGHLPRFVAAWKGVITSYAADLTRRDDVELVGSEMGFDFREGFGIHAADPTGAGVVVAMPLPVRTRRRRLASEAPWERIAAHIAAGFRIHRRALGLRLDAEAVLDPGGRLLDAQGPAAEKSARSLLRSACQTVDRARTREGRSDPDSVERWTSLFGARWSLVDRFDRDGRRFVIAVRNVVANESKPLTAREAQVVGLVALGHSNKLISYELGLAWSTVRVLVQRAARKLGVRTRAELEQKAASFQLEQPPEAAPPTRPR